MKSKILREFSKWWLLYSSSVIQCKDHYLRVYKSKSPKDDPLKVEELVVSILMTAFLNQFRNAVQEGLASGRLASYLAVSYQQGQTVVPDSSYLLSYLMAGFGTEWSNQSRSEIYQIMDEMYSLAEEEVAESVGQSYVPSTAEERAEVLDQLTSVAVLWMSYGLSNQVLSPSLDEALEVMIANDATATEALDVLEYYLTDVVPVVATAYYTNLSTVVVNMDRGIARFRAAGALGYQKVRWVTIPDELLCFRCEAMDGQEFSISTLEGLVANLLTATSPSEFITAHPFPAWNRSEGSFVMPDGTTISPDEGEMALAEAGIGLMPLHGSCRCYWEPA